ncbi:MAG: polysaccharide deacetylase family protein [Coriobacteriia bacterium]|nr:polysaccharide deacetylase family protein [Coriobacteriia bacterium]
MFDARIARTMAALLAVTAVVSIATSAPLFGIRGVPRRSAAVIRDVPIGERVVAMTVDDGPSDTYTPRVLDELARTGSRATFFVVGTSAQLHPALVRRQVALGCEVAAHTWSHPDMGVISSDETSREVWAGATAIEEITGRWPSYFRPPRGRVTPAGLRAAAAADLRVVNWSLCIESRKLPSPEARAARILRRVHPGDIILVHDGMGRRAGSVAALAIVLDGLKARGYRVVTVSELLGSAAR